MKGWIASVAVGVFAAVGLAADGPLAWPQFRGPSGAGIGRARNVVPSTKSIAALVDRFARAIQVLINFLLAQDYDLDEPCAGCARSAPMVRRIFQYARCGIWRQWRRAAKFLSTQT